MFPISFEGQIELLDFSPEQIDAVAGRVASALVRVRARNVCCDGNVVTFHGGMFRLVSSWNILAPVSHGTIEVHGGSPSNVTYKLVCVEMLVVTTLMVAIAGFAIPSKAPTLFRLGAPALLWLWLFGMNYLVAMYRLPAFLRRAVRA